MSKLIRYRNGVLGVDLRELKKYGSRFRLTDENRNVLYERDVSGVSKLEFDVRGKKKIELDVLKEGYYCNIEHVYLSQKNREGDPIEVRGELHLTDSEVKGYLNSFEKDIREVRKNANRQ